MRFIVLSSFESLDLGLSNKLFPDILQDQEFRVIIVSRSHKNSLLRDLCKKVNSGVKTFKYKETTRITETESSSN